MSLGVIVLHKALLVPRLVDLADDVSCERSVARTFCPRVKSPGRRALRLHARPATTTTLLQGYMNPTAP